MVVDPVPALVVMIDPDDRGRDRLVEYWAFSVPRTGDRVRYLGTYYEIVAAEWSPQGHPVVQQEVTLTLKRLP